MFFCFISCELLLEMVDRALPCLAIRTFILWGSMAASASAAAFLFYSSYTSPRCRSSSLHDFKPQRNFKVVLADNSTRPFVHLRTPQNTEEMELHPFHDKISIFLENISIPRTPVSTEAGPPLMTEPFVWIDTKSQLVKLAEILSQEREFAVDTEQHSVRSFLGFTALIQVSTLEQDFLIDAIALHDEMGILGNVFQDANICKWSSRIWGVQCIQSIKNWSNAEGIMLYTSA